MKTNKTLNELYSFPGFKARSKLKGMFGDSPARIIALVRRQKKRYAAHAARPRAAFTIVRCIRCAMSMPGASGCTWNSSIAGWTAAHAMV